MLVDRVLPGEEFIDRERVAVAGFLQREKATTHRRDHLGLAADDPALPGILDGLFGSRMPGSSMPEYRIYTIGGDGRAWSAEELNTVMIKKPSKRYAGSHTAVMSNFGSEAVLSRDCPGCRGPSHHPIIFEYPRYRALRGRRRSRHTNHRG